MTTWIEMLRVQASPGEEVGLATALRFLVRERPEHPVTAAALWSHDTPTTEFCVILRCEHDGPEPFLSGSPLGQRIERVMRASGLLWRDVWREPNDPSRELR